MGSFKLYAALGAIAVLMLSFGWHKHVVHDRNHWHAEASRLRTELGVATAAVKASETLRADEARAARQSAQAAQSQCDARVAEARRSAGAVKRLVEKPRATDPVSHCPVPDIVPAGELRDALQPHPYG